MAKETKAAVGVGGENVNVLQDAVLVTLRFSQPGNTGSVDAEKVDTNADKDMFHVSKRLLDSAEFRAVLNHRWRWRHSVLASLAITPRVTRYIKRTNGNAVAQRTVSFLAGTATQILPLALLERAERAMQEQARIDAELIEAYLAVYPAQVQEAREKLKEEFRSEEYPPVDAVRAAFGARWYYMTASVPDSIKRVNAALHTKEVDKFYSGLEDAALEVRMVIREEMAELVNWVVERLADTPDGKAKSFGKPFEQKLARFAEFLELFKDRNLTRDTDLEALVNKAKALVKGVDADAVKDDKKFRDRIRNGFAGIKTALAPMIDVKPMRRIILDD